jgi:small subunit ribosomal protein S25e
LQKKEKRANLPVFVCCGGRKPPKAGAKKAAPGKNQKPKAPKAGGSGKDKKKWSKGRTKEKLQNKVIFDKETYDKLMKELPSYKVITPSIVADRLKVNGALARQAIKELANKGLIRAIALHSAQTVYTRAKEEVKTEAAPAATTGKAPKKAAAKKTAEATPSE